MGLIKWGSHYSVGVRLMDEHHQKLFALINTMYDAMREGRGRDVIGPILVELADYTDYHFSAEERLLREHGYPEQKMQEAYHRELAGKTRQMKQGFDQGGFVPTMEVMLFLSNWLNYHILDEDKKYGPFLNSKGIF